MFKFFFFHLNIDFLSYCCDFVIIFNVIEQFDRDSGEKYFFFFLNRRNVSKSLTSYDFFFRRNSFLRLAKINRISGRPIRIVSRNFNFFASFVQLFIQGLKKLKKQTAEEKIAKNHCFYEKK
jgi:hypothetical protein